MKSLKYKSINSKGKKSVVSKFKKNHQYSGVKRYPVYLTRRELNIVRKALSYDKGSVIDNFYFDSDSWKSGYNANYDLKKHFHVDDVLRNKVEKPLKHKR